jgi:hypothetical protein
MLVGRLYKYSVHAGVYWTGCVSESLSCLDAGVILLRCNSINEDLVTYGRINFPYVVKKIPSLNSKNLMYGSVNFASDV